MAKNKEFWKVTGIYLIILNLILVIIFSGFVIDRKISNNQSENKLFEIEFNNYDFYKNKLQIGEKTAPLTIVVYTDYESPYCRKFEDKIYEKLKEEYIDTNKVKIIVKDFPLEIHKNSLIAAQAVKCAGDEKKAYEMHKLILNNRNPNEDNLKIWANEIGLNETSFSDCLNSQKYLDEVLLNIEEAKENEVKTVPTIFIGEQKIEGVKPYFIMKRIIDKELENLN